MVSDANAVRNLLTHGFAADLTDAGARALNTGVDMEMAIADPAYAHLPEAVQNGVVDAATLDAGVRRVLEAKLRLGLVDDPYVDEDRARAVLGDPAHREVARVAAERSAVLLRNEGGLLPLDPAGVGLDRRDRPAGRLPPRHVGPVVLRLRPHRDGHGPRRHPCAGDATSALRPRHCGPPSGPRRRSSTCTATTGPRTRRISTTRPSSSGRSTPHEPPTSPSWWWASGRSWWASRRRGRRWSCPAASWSCCRRCRRPAPPSCCS